MTMMTRCFCCCFPSLLLNIFLFSVVVVDATIYVNNETLASLPGLFGAIMRDGRIYEARLQFLPENPYLCDPINEDSSSFVKPSGPTIPSASQGNISLYEPVVLLAGRGQCPFQRKAANAERLGTVEFLIVYNFNLDSEDTLVPMYSEFGDTRLVLLSITHRSGVALKRYIAEQPQAVLQRGGPLLRFDNMPPDGLLSVDELRNMLLSALGLFFMLISFSGCIMIVAGTYGHVQMEGSRLVFTRHADYNAAMAAVAAAANNGANNIPMAAFHQAHHRRRFLLTQVQVLKLAEESKYTSINDNDNSVMDNDDDAACAVCIDEFTCDDDTETTITLPCHHKFHTHCILPWLTERQSKCPLCKFDVLEYVREKEAAQALADSNSSSSSARNKQQRSGGGDTAAASDDGIAGTAVPSWWDRIVRYRWTTVHNEDETDPQQQQPRVEDDTRRQQQGEHHHQRDGILRPQGQLRSRSSGGGVERETAALAAAAAELELTERRSIT